MFFRFLSFILLVVTGASGASRFRVCADPNNLPYSNRSEQGFENRLASMIAANLGERLEYTWWAERKSFLKNSLLADRCDAVMGVPSNLSSVAVTQPYYRSTYVIVTRRDRNLEVHSLLDDRLAKLRIGVHVVGDDYAPPAQLLARQGLAANLEGFSLFGVDGEPNPPARLIEAVKNGTIDVAIAWGPLAGYFSRDARPALDILPVEPPAYMGVPFSYSISVAVRKDDTNLRDRIDAVLQENRTAVHQLLTDYAVPLADGEKR